MASLPPATLSAAPPSSCGRSRKAAMQRPALKSICVRRLRPHAWRRSSAMTHEIDGSLWLNNYLEKRDTLIAAHAYSPADEKDACGVGLVAQIDGTPRREVVEMAIRALKA